TVEPERDPAVWRRPEFQRVDEEAEPRLRLLVRHAEHLEHQPLDALVVDTNAAAADLAAVEHEIVGARAHRARVRLQTRRVGFERRGEGMMHELPALLFL